MGLLTWEWHYGAEQHGKGEVDTCSRDVAAELDQFNSTDVATVMTAEAAVARLRQHRKELTGSESGMKWQAAGRWASRAKNRKTSALHCHYLSVTEIESVAEDFGGSYETISAAVDGEGTSYFHPWLLRHEVWVHKVCWYFCRRRRRRRRDRRSG